MASGHRVLTAREQTGSVSKKGGVMTIRSLLVCALLLTMGAVNAKTLECSFEAGGDTLRFTMPLIPPDPQRHPKNNLRASEFLARLTPQEREQMRQQMRQHWREESLPQREVNRQRRQVGSNDNYLSIGAENRPPPDRQQHQGHQHGAGGRDSGRFDEGR